MQVQCILRGTLSSFLNYLQASGPTIVSQTHYFFNATANAEIVFPISPNRNTTENLKEIVKYEKN